jgi:GT2 family glycosyltransferase
MIQSTVYPFEIRVIEEAPALGPAAARNRALSVAEAELILFLDDDVVPTEQLVATHAMRHSEDPNAVVIGTLLAPAEHQQPWIRWEAETLLKQYADMQSGAWAPTPRQFYTGNASVRRQHVLAAGGFDSALRRGEDVELAFRLQRNGARFVFEPAASGIHYARRSFASWLEAAGDYGRIEAVMEPIGGTRGLVDFKQREFQGRHPMVRRLVRIGLRSPGLVPVLVGAGRVAGWVLARLGLWRLARGIYTAIFELAYWRGVESAPAGKAPRQVPLAEANAGNR